MSPQAYDQWICCEAISKIPCSETSHRIKSSAEGATRGRLKFGKNLRRGFKPEICPPLADRAKELFCDDV